jgi:hypothetical protein
MAEISAFGLSIVLRASNTFPSGITLSQFADDADPFDTPSIEIGQVAMGLNGDMVAWSTPNPITATINVIPGSDDDKNLEILAENNKVTKGKLFSRDNIEMTVVYPDGRIVTGRNGTITNYVPFPSAANSGRIKTRAYSFAFEKKTG